MIYIYNLGTRWYPWSILWFATFVWIRWFSSRIQLLVPGWLCGSWQAIFGNHLSFVGLQDQVSRELFHFAWQPWISQYQSHIWLLRRVWVIHSFFPHTNKILMWIRQTTIQHQVMEDIYRLFQLPTDCCCDWWKDLYNAWWSFSWFAKPGTNPTSDASNRCAWYR